MKLTCLNVSANYGGASYFECIYTNRKNAKYHFRYIAPGNGGMSN